MIKRYAVEGELIYQKDDGHLVRYEDYGILQQKFGGVSSLCEEAMRINCEWEKSMMAAIGEDGIGSVTKAIEQLKADKHALQQKLDAIIGGFEEAIRHKDKLAAELDAANEKLTRYSMSAGQADQFAAEAKSVRIALGFEEDAQDVAPVDLLEKISGLRADAVIEASAYLADIAQGKSPHTAELIKSCGRTVFAYGESLRSGTHDTAEKAGAK